MEKAVDNQELMKCIKGDQLFMLAAVKILKLPERKKMYGKKCLLRWELDIMPTQKRYNTIRTSFMKQVCEASKKPRELSV